ncbi:MAG TPA: pectate lyase, partial [Candidatus Hydrogenedentes bacterium]|nr:pectate lyase [Candidatus Hydrogenedentota bacterium]
VADWVLAGAGARPADRDAVDTRVVDGVRTGAGRIIDSQEQVGGMPQDAATRRPLEPPPAPGADDDRDGYTNLEEWLHAQAGEVEGG